jgi:hypothetical protein
MHALFVTNHNEKVHVDRYDGVDYVFPPGEAVAIPEGAAVLFFGHGQENKTEALQRVGLAFHVNRTSNAIEDNPAGGAWLANFTFEQAVLRPVSAIAQAIGQSKTASSKDASDRL